jgi:GTP cyclohydrolase III
VEIQLGGKPVTKSIAEWVLRRRELASLELGAWDSLSDRHLRDKTISTTSGKEEKVTVVRHFDVNERDLKVDTLTHEPSIIDSKLEVVNATTDLEGYTLPESLAE